MFKSIMIITQNIDSNIDEKVALEQLKISYEKILQNKYGEILRKTLESNRSEKQVVDR